MPQPPPLCNSSRAAGSSKVLRSPVIASPAAACRRSLRMIFPERVFGSLLTKRISSGLAIPPICFTTSAQTSSWSKLAGFVEVPDFSLQVTKATIACPLISWGRPTTAASATWGWVTIALSISAVPRRWPATLRTSSILPDIQKYPSSSR